jgi:RNA polymerase sigma-70 factor, ECF subfamily
VVSLRKRSALFFTGVATLRHSPWSPVNRTSAKPQSRPAQAVSPTLDAIYDEHFDFVWRSLRRLGVPADALDDALQEVFLVVHRRLSDFEQRSTLTTWLFGIAMRVARDQARKRQKYGPLRELDAELEDPDARSPLEDAARSEARDLLYLLLGALDEDKRAAFILAEIEGMSVPEIATGLGVNVNTLMSRVRAARREFEAALARHRARSDFPRSTR